MTRTTVRANSAANHSGGLRHQANATVADSIIQNNTSADDARGGRNTAI